MTDRIVSNQSSPTVQFILEADASADATYGDHGRWRIRCYLRAVNTGTSSSQYNNAGTQYGIVNGATVMSHSGNPFLPAVAAGATRWRDGPDDTYINANANGYFTGSDTTLPLAMRLAYGSIDTTPSTNLSLPRIARAPGTASTPSVSNVTSTGATLSGFAASRGNDDIDNFQLQYATNSSFTGATTISNGTATSKALTGLTPNTTYYFRYRAHSGDGYGGYSATVSFVTIPGAPANPPTFSAITPTSVTISWSNPSGSLTGITGYEYQIATDSAFTAVVATVSVGVVNSDNTADNVTLNPGTTYYVRVRAKVGTTVGLWSGTGSFQTIVSTPPTFVVSSSPSGTQSTLVLSPPAGVTSVNSYTVERRLQGTTTPVTTASTASNTVTMSGLTPGAIYEYRATATIGTFVSPFSAWVPFQQSNPNTSPGSFFDGNSNPTTNETFRWTGTVNLSTSEMVGQRPLNWAFAEAVNGGKGVVTRVVGGWDRDYAARLMVTADATGAGLRWGQELTASPSDVVPLATYYASVYVNPSRDQRLSAEITWLNDALAVVSRDTNAGTLCAAGDWTRLSVNAAAPATAEFALVRIIDVTGSGWSVWLSGQSCLADAAMLTLDSLFPYFDGDTTDTTDYTYDWEGAPDNSESTRTVVPVPSAVVIRDPDCPPLPTPPKPPSIASDCIDETGVWRRYWALIPASEVSMMLYTLPAIVVHTQGVALRQLRVRLYQAPAGEDDPNAIDPNSWISEMVVSYVPPNTVLVLDSVEQRATASVNGSQPTDAGHLLYGSNGAPVVWPVLNCGVNYFVSFDTPVTVPIGNQTFEAILTQRY